MNGRSVIILNAELLELSQKPCGPRDCLAKTHQHVNADFLVKETPSALITTTKMDY